MTRVADRSVASVLPLDCPSGPVVLVCPQWSSALAQGVRRISEYEVRALLRMHVIIDIVEERHRYVILGEVDGRALIAVVSDDELDDATVLISVYEPDADRGWTTEQIDRILRGEGPEEAPR